MRTKRLFLICIASCLLVISFPKVDLPYCIWFALVPLLAALEGKSVYRCFLTGWWCGFLFSIGLIYWIVVVTTTYGHLPYAMGVVLMLLLAAYLALYVGGACALARYVEQRSYLSLPLVLPFAWVALEYLRSFLFSGFPWENLGYSQYRMLTIMQCADITGVYGVSLLIVWVNAALYLTLRGARRGKFVWKPLGFTLLLFSAVVLYGRVRMDEVSTLLAKADPITVGLVQGNIAQDIKWNNDFRQEALNIHQTLTRETLRSGVRLVIWPESATPFYLEHDPAYQEALFTLIRGTGAYLLVGSPSLGRENKRLFSFNSAFLLSPEADIIGRYDKIHLVPFGEYVPLQKLLFFVDKMVEGIGEFKPGETVVLMPFPQAPFAVLICYEIIFPDLTRRFVKRGATFLVNITNDGWFGDTSAPYQHFSMAAVRAIENKRYVARAANTGVSGFISPLGEVQAASDVFTQAALNGTLRPLGMITFYTRYGDVFSIAVCIGILLLIVPVKRRAHIQFDNFD